jgi:3-deoxy-7-phosphoheptulonate synthase
MIIVMEPGASKEHVDAVIRRVEELGYQSHPIVGIERTVVACVGHEDKTPLEQLQSMESVESVIQILKSFKLASRELKKEPSILDVDGVKVGAGQLAIIAGPCSVESREQTLEIAEAVRESGARFCARAPSSPGLPPVHSRA